MELRGKSAHELYQLRTELSREEFNAIPFINADGYHNKTIAYSIWHIFRIEEFDNLTESWREYISMAVSKIKAVFQSDVQRAWEVVTSLKNYSWRSDLSKIEILNENEFIEYTKDGYPTTFKITRTVPYKRWEFDMENSNMKGHWTGIFTEKGDNTEIDFTEEVMAKKIIMKPFVKSYLKRQQELYISDLRKVL